MPAPDIILDKQFVLISQTGSVLGGGSVGSGTLMGTIANIYSTSDRYSINDVVAYNTIGQQLVNYSGTEYALIDEKNILYKEIAPP